MNGRFYQGRQGTGLATTLGQQPGEQFQMKQALLDKEQRKKQLSEAANKLGKLTMPEHFYKHKQEISDAFGGVIQEGAKLLSKGIDPFNTFTEQTKKFQEGWEKLGTMGDYSMQLKEAYDKGRSLYQSNQDKYSGWGQFQEFFDNNSLNDIVDKNLNVPQLTKNRALKEIVTYHKNNMADLVRKNNGAPVSEDQLKEYAAMVIQDPGTWTELQQSYDAKFQQLSEEQKKNLQHQADLNGISIYEQAIINDANTWNAQEKPFSVKTTLDEIAATLTPKRSKIEEGDITTTSVSVSDSAIREAIREKLLDDPRIAEGITGDPVEGVFKRYKGMIRNRLKTSYERTADESGKLGGMDKKEYDGKRKKWLADLKSGRQEAADYLRRYKPPGEDLEVYKTKHEGDKVMVYMKGKAVEDMKNKPLFDEEIQDSKVITFGEEEGWSLSDNLLPVFLRGNAVYLPDEDAVVRIIDLSQQGDKEKLYEMYDFSFKKHNNKPYDLDSEPVGAINNLFSSKGGSLDFNNATYNE